MFEPMGIGTCDFLLSDWRESHNVAPVARPQWQTIPAQEAVTTDTKPG